MSDASRTALRSVTAAVMSHPESGGAHRRRESPRCREVLGKVVAYLVSQRRALALKQEQEQVDTMLALANGP